jgi:hypothetical protein
VLNGSDFDQSYAPLNPTSASRGPSSHTTQHSGSQAFAGLATAAPSRQFFSFASLRGFPKRSPVRISRNHLSPPSVTSAWVV